ncbi:c-type cytochrome [Leptospira santarosai]|uniref:Cytochrome C n=1 Tax=Leptospira santarosai serovar Arenal str. MAVJ 401 TaxID=1049976 RepID=M6JIX7_9LEPT|nr:cytochrome c [Leptospira santarosai]EMN21656.1 cytochrome C [Leptospira santarosai serovar Arenal str. MAVJ 401]EMO83873.1 cytochrome C [Leptospira santarosai str. AIM]MDI7229457.1 cytochrome c [Leptospira santarosai]
MKYYKNLSLAGQNLTHKMRGAEFPALGLSVIENIGSKASRRSLIFLLAAVLFWNCESKTPPLEYFPDMADSPAREAQEADPIAHDGAASRIPPKGAVPVGYYPYEYLGSDVTQLPNKGLSNPFKNDLANLQKGEAKYQTYCSPCHGVRGAGNGTIVGPAPRIGFPVPAVISPKIQGYSDGQIYHVITAGWGRMKSYASQVSPEDRWKIVLYVRKLQEYDNRTKKDVVRN